MNIEKTELKLVQISTGSVVEPTHVRTYTPYGDTKPVRDFYTGRLTKAGLPPKNGANFNWNDEARWSQNRFEPEAERRGSIGIYNAEREVWANKARARIAELEEALERAEDELHAIYAGPKPADRKVE